MNDLEAAARQLVKAVDGINWDAAQVGSSIDAIHRFGEHATAEQRDFALKVLVDRLHLFSVDDGDGTAHVAITAGTLVEFGASAEPLAEVLLEKIPSVLIAARECADVCLADPRTPTEIPEDDQSDLLTEVDQCPILGEVFRDHLEQHRARAALAYLEQWTLAAVAAWTRSRADLLRAKNDPHLVELAECMAESEASWLRVLLGAQLESSWVVLCPMEERGFRVLLDGVASNQDLHVQLAAALIPRGIEGTACSDDVVAYLEGHGKTPKKKWVAGTWNLYDYRAGVLDLADGSQVPHEYWVWAEGIPNDIPQLPGEPILIIGPASVQRSWSLERTFSALPSRVKMIEELQRSAWETEMARVRTAGLD
jgi:hypothetical protein